MMSITLLDDKGTRLQKEGDIDIEVNNNILGNENPLNSYDSIKLYKLDRLSGTWMEQSELKRKSTSSRTRRQIISNSVTIPGITIDEIMYNFDAVAQTTCFSKVRLFTDETLKRTGQLSGGLVSILVKGDDGTYSLSQVRAMDDKDSNGYCTAHRCKSEYYYDNFNGFLSGNFM